LLCLPHLPSDVPCHRSTVGGHFHIPIHRRLASWGWAVSLSYPHHALSSWHVRRPPPQYCLGPKVVWVNTVNRPPPFDVSTTSYLRRPAVAPCHRHLIYLHLRPASMSSATSPSSSTATSPRCTWYPLLTSSRKNAKSAKVPNFHKNTPIDRFRSFFIGQVWRATHADEPQKWIIIWAHSTS